MAACCSGLVAVLEVVVVVSDLASRGDSDWREEWFHRITVTSMTNTTKTDGFRRRRARSFMVMAFVAGKPLSLVLYSCQPASHDVVESLEASGNTGLRQSTVVTGSIVVKGNRVEQHKVQLRKQRLLPTDTIVVSVTKLLAARKPSHQDYY